MTISLCILAAGKGQRMRSAIPKVLHQIAGKPLVAHVLDTTSAITPTRPVVVFGHGGSQLQQALANRPISWVEQREQLGTGHAVAQALPLLPADHLVLILYGDVPLIRRATLEQLLEASRASGFSLLTAKVSDPLGYGRIVRDTAGQIARIVEQKDAAADELLISEINSGIMVVRGEYLHRWLPTLANNNAQGEYYLTDCVLRAVSEGIVVQGVTTSDEMEIAGVNDRNQLAALERVHQRRFAQSLMANGVTLMDPARVDVRGELVSGTDTTIDINVVFEGQVTLGCNVRIGPNCVIANASLGDNVEVLANSVIDGARIGAGARIGPFARIRPETELAEGVHVGNFVEVKKSRLGKHSKANHLAYLGDADIGNNVNVGAGTITCNYDGAFKHKTVIEDDVFIGSDTQLVAPVTIGRGVTIGAGTTVTENVEPDRLVISRVRQKTISGWKRPAKPKSDA
jgi:bifunctional UDP-N-acetylglucosamine pyrophosphorylase/glucosamine-1-phosphate N-acetyltransferase